jgi:predicted phosphodiesterase
MRLLILSDLHREIYPGRDLGIDLSVSKPDVVILAGDIASGARGVLWAHETFPTIPVIYVAGNHEYYQGDIDIGQAAITTTAENFCDRVHFLNGDQVVIGGVRFVGGTLWTDFELYGEDRRLAAMSHARTSMNDFHVIAKGSRKLLPVDTTEIHLRHMLAIAQALEIPFEGKTVVITHHLPSEQSIPQQYKGDFLNAAYASNLEHLVSKADVWMHGHTHDSMDYQIDKCRVVCNPCGYVTRNGTNENPSFNPNLIVEI